MREPVVFIDTETTGLDPDRHELWDIALIEPDGTEHEFHRRPGHASDADPGALRVTDFYRRTAAHEWRWDSRTDAVIAQDIALITSGMHLVAAVPSFDAAFLARFLRDNGQCEAWHYHLVDVEALVAGKLCLAPPWDSSALAEAIGVERLDGKHTAIGDARWARDIYRAVFAR